LLPVAVSTLSRLANPSGKYSLMSDVLSIAGSPSANSRTAEVLRAVNHQVEQLGYSADLLSVRHLNAEELLYGQFDGSSIRAAAEQVANARAIVIATPVYKASFSGILKAFLDLLPQHALADKVILPIALGGSPGHLLTIDYALKPVLSALGATTILNGVYILDSQVKYTGEYYVELDDTIQQRLTQALATLQRHLHLNPLESAVLT